jgi:hypothetical protein
MQMQDFLARSWFLLLQYCDGWLHPIWTEMHHNLHFDSDNYRVLPVTDILYFVYSTGDVYWFNLLPEVN